LEGGKDMTEMKKCLIKIGYQNLMKRIKENGKVNRKGIKEK
jgi:hypothetical protein